ncbi:MAG: amino acid permease [bacterium]|nr:amino acid permease [bacterium]
MKQQQKSTNSELRLARTLGIPEVALLGIGALLGGGIFTLLGHAAGLAGPGLVFAMLLGSGIAFINLNSYIALATTFPAAGGGYHWVTSGLGPVQGFLSGWFSWMASAIACSLYAVSFGIIAEEFFFDFLELSRGVWSSGEWSIAFTVGAVVLFGMINYRGVKLSGKIGGAIVLAILALLGAFLLFGLKQAAFHPDLVAFNFSAFLPMGIAGVLQAAALFYIAFEGSEIQAQTGEEVKNPARALKHGLFISWGVVSVIYILVAMVIIGATDGGGVPSWQFIGAVSDRAMIAAGSQFMPFGYVLMLVGGLLANLAAMNATIYSSSRVLFSLGRDKLIWQKLGVMHPIYFVPTRALLLSLVIIVAAAAFLPLTDIASLADILFIGLFLQLNLAYIQLRRQNPEAKWQYIVPLEPYLPMLGVFCYAVLGIALFHVSPMAIMFFGVWLLLGLVNYLGYAKHVERDDHDREVVYEHSMRFHPKSEYRVVLPVGNESDWRKFLDIASAMTREEGGDLIALRIHETKEGQSSEDAFHSSHEEHLLHEIEEDMAKKRLNVDTRIVSSRSVPEAILETITTENADLVLMNWDGDVNTKGFIFGRKIDVVLHRAKCDMLTVKLGSGEKMNRVFLPVAIDVNPNLRFTGKVATALFRTFGSKITVAMVVPEDVRGESDEFYRKVLEERVQELKVKIPGGVESKVVYSDYVASGILKSTQDAYDAILLPASRGGITKAIGVGSIPEQVAKQCRRKTVIIAKGYRGVGKPLWEYLRERF